MPAGAIRPAVSYAAVVARGKSTSPSRDPDSPTRPAESVKGKARENKVTFADNSHPNERTALLRQQSSSSGERNGYETDEDRDGDDEDTEEAEQGIIARARRALRLGRDQQRDALPLYAEDGRTQRPIPLRGALGALLGLILVAALVASAMLVRSGSEFVLEQAVVLFIYTQIIILAPRRAHRLQHILHLPAARGQVGHATQRTLSKLSVGPLRAKQRSVQKSV